MVVVMVLVVAAAAGDAAGWLARLLVVAHFDRVVGLYVGSDVRILGVKIGSVTAITPMGDDVPGRDELPREDAIRPTPTRC